MNRTSILESLENRTFFSVTAEFTGGVLTVTGDGQANTINVSRNAAGNILINGGAVTTRGTPTVANTDRIQLFGLGGNDTLSLEETNGALPRVNAFGGAGNDTLIGGSGTDQLFGQAGNDTLLGKGGNDQLFGGADNDTLTGGDADDSSFGEGGADRMVWNPGDDTDKNEGGAGTDTVEVNGGNGAEAFTATANGSRVRFDRVNPAPFALDIGTTENLTLNANGGDDSFSATGSLAALIRIVVDGGTGDDTLAGSDGGDLLLGGDGNDSVKGNRGDDVVLLGAGDDTATWNPGDGNDVVEGQDGTDTLQFNGSNADETMAVSANGNRVRLTRDIATVTMDLNDTERVDIAALGGADAITVGDLSGTDATNVNVLLAATLGGTAADAQPDNVTVTGTNGVDDIDVFGSGGSYAALGLAATVTVTGSNSTDLAVINALAGDDTVSAATLQAVTTRLTVDAGSGNDTILGGDGADLVLGGDGNDVVAGNRGNDVALLGAGDDTFTWGPGDGNDIVEGQTGTDALAFNGSGASENIGVSANAGRVRFTRDVAAVVMDLDNVEGLTFTALGGTDVVTIGDLSGTDATEINIDFGATPGSATGDGRPDDVIVTGTNGDDVAVVVASGGNASVLGLVARVNVSGAEAANDELIINALAGDDVVDASGMAAGSILFTADGGSDNDVLLGGEGNDILLGNAGDDVLIGNGGNDILDGGDGDDIELQLVTLTTPMPVAAQLQLARAAKLTAPLFAVAQRITF